MYRVIWCFWRRNRKHHPHSHPHAARKKHCTITQCCFNGASASKAVGSTLKQHWVNSTCLGKVHSKLSDGLVLGQRHRRFAGIEPVLNDAYNAISKVIFDHTTRSHIPENPMVDTKIMKLLLFCRKLYQFNV